ncbi:hypothetical protein ACYT85_15080 [Ralstonia solanacearum]
MALKKCRECNTEVSGEAKTCPRCGVKNPAKRTSLLAKIALSFVALVVIGRLTATPPEPATATTTTSTTSPSAPASWSYSSDPDNMGKGTIRFASIESINTLEFKFPYSGEQHATLTIRKHPRHGNDAIIQIQRGQFVCPVSGCSVMVRFDDGESTRYRAAEPADHSTTALFLEPYNKFYMGLAKSKRVRIEVDFYQEGSRMVEFNVAGFNPTAFMATK